jgi:hypothetical protein
MFDLFLIETKDGGDVVLEGNDLKVVFGFENMPYLALFGGNPGESTREFQPTEQRLDWWGNDRFFQNQPSIQINSGTQNFLSKNALSSAGRLRIEQQILADLSFMEDFATLETELSQTAPDRLEIKIRITEKTNQQSSEFTYLWDATEKNLIQL